MIYLIEDKASNALKIGYSKNDPHGRLSAFQTGNANELKLLHVLEGDRDEELRLKKFYKSHNIRGEWFVNHVDIVRYFILNEYDYYPDTFKYRREEDNAKDKRKEEERQQQKIRNIKMYGKSYYCKTKN